MKKNEYLNEKKKLENNKNISSWQRNDLLEELYKFFIKSNKKEQK